MGRMRLKYAALVFFLYSFELFCVTSKWNGSGTLWNAPASWTPTNIPKNANDIAQFTLATLTPPQSTTVTIDVPAPGATLGTLEFDFGMNYTVNPGVGNLVMDAGAGTAQITITNNNGNGAHTINASVTLNSDLTVSQGSTGEFTISGKITGSTKDLNKTGTGVLYLSHAAGNTFKSTSISSGTVKIDVDTALGTAGNAVTIGSGNLLFNMNDTTSRPISLTGSAGIQAAAGQMAILNGIISGSGSLTISDSGTVVLGNTNTYSGGTIVSSGTLQITSNANLGNTSGTLNFDGGTLKVLTNSFTISRSGTVSATSIIDSIQTVTFTGDFGGAGGLTFRNGGTFVLVGNNSYSGGSTIEASTHLTGTTNGVQGNITLEAASSRLSFSQNFNGNYSGALTSSVVGAGQINKQGTGTVTFSGTSTAYSGTTTVSEGTLDINGTLSSSSVTALAGGTIGGLGRIIGPVTVNANGTLDPGSYDTIGRLDITTGPLTLDPGANTTINIAPTGADHIVVTGAAAINGALLIEPIPGFYGFAADYTILTSSGIGGALWSPIGSTNPNFIPSVLYSATQAFLHIDILEPFAVFPFSNENTAAVGNNIDALFAAGQLSPDMFNIFNSFIGQSINTINHALDEMHPAPYSAFVEQQTEMAGQLVSLFHRFPYLPCSCDGSNRFWVKPFGDSLTVKSHGIQVGFQSNSGGLALGYDGEIAPNWIFGFGTAWNTSHLDWHRSRGKGEVNGFFGAAYTDYQWGSFYFGAALLTGIDFYDTDRDIKFLNLHRHAKASYRAVDVVGQLASAYLFGSPQAFFYPYLNLDYLYIATESYQEEGAGSLSLLVEDRGDGTLRTEAGLALQVQDINAAQTMCISPQVSFGYVNMTQFQRPRYESFFEGTTIPFKVEGWNKTWNLLHIDFGLSLTYRCFSFGIKYNVELSPDSDTTFYNQHGDLRFDWKW